MADPNHCPPELAKTLFAISKAGAEGVCPRDVVVDLDVDRDQLRAARRAVDAWAQLIQLGAVEVIQVPIITETRLVVNRHGRKLLTQAAREAVTKARGDTVIGHALDCASLRAPVECDCGLRKGPGDG